ncbi:MAG: transcription termination factor NusA [Treponema sp.]|nr:transcription termination factor NusA [Treponema sp.]
MEIDVSEAFDQLMQERNMSEEHIRRTIEDTLLVAYRRRYKIPEKTKEFINGREISVPFPVNAVIRFSDDRKVSIFAKKKIVDAEEDGISNPIFEIDLEDARKLNPDAEIGDEILIPVNPKEFTRAAIKSAKQTAQHSIRNIQNTSLYDGYKNKIGEIIIGYYQRERNGDIYVDLGKVEGFLPKRNQSPREYFRVNDRIKAIITDVRKTSSGIEIVLSRVHPDFVRAILTLEVPEVYDKTVGIHRVVRHPGYRTKVAVFSTKEEVDPVGACVGLKGVRTQAIIKELEGEKVDILKYDTDPCVFIKNALSPAVIAEVVIFDENKRQALAVVDDSQLSLAIGKQGNNVKLANKLVDWSIDVKTKSQFAEMDINAASRRAASELFAEADEYARISELPGVDAEVAEILKNNNADFIEDFIKLTSDQLVEMNIQPDQLDTLRKLIEEYVDIVEEEEEPVAEAAFATEPEVFSEIIEDSEEYECPECGAKITLDMTNCPNCGVGLSFEYEEI